MCFKLLTEKFSNRNTKKGMASYRKYSLPTKNLIKLLPKYYIHLNLGWGMGKWDGKSWLQI